mmetsp:Transcript_50974/g.120660  ORF Transcript_50974/g.120660 Transcript_50974/m.120660 type:complete len:257 (-) Transcript_50974:537-1307(-)
MELAVGAAACVAVLASNVDGEDEMGAGGVLVDVVAEGGPVVPRLPPDVYHLLVGAYREQREVLDVVAVGALAHLELLPRRRVEEVADLLVVDLEDGELDRVGVGVGALPDEFEDPSERPRVDALLRLAPLHRERLAGSGLAVGEDADVVTVEHRDHQRLHLREHLRLRALRPEAAVELEDLLGALGVVQHRDVVLRYVRPPVLGEEDSLLVAGEGCLVGKHGPDAAEHSDVPLQLQHEVVEALPLLDNHLVLLRPP